MNAASGISFRSIESPERVLEWEQTPAALGWRRFSTPLYTLAAVVVAILLYTQQDLLSQMLAIATGAAGALNSLRSLGIMANAQNRPATRDRQRLVDRRLRSSRSVHGGGPRRLRHQPVGPGDAERREDEHAVDDGLPHDAVAVTVVQPLLSEPASASACDASMPARELHAAGRRSRPPR